MKAGAQPSSPPWIRFLLSGLLPGLGQAWGGRPVAGVILYLAHAVLLAALLFSRLDFRAGLAIALVVRFLIAVGAARFPPRADMAGRVRWWYAILLVLLAALGHLGRITVAPVFEVRGVSMEPALLDGDQAAADTFVHRFRAPVPGEVVVFRPPNFDRLLVKRVAAVSGEAVPAAPRTPDAGRFSTVPEGCVFVLGDNLPRAPDSRDFGPVPVAGIRGRLERIVWSWDREKDRVRWSRIGKTIE